MYISLKKLIDKTVQTLTRIYRIEPDLIVIFMRSYSGSNVLPLIEAAREDKLAPYRFQVYMLEKGSELSSLHRLKLMWKRYKLINQAKLVITTHGPMKVKKDTLNLELWHGFPLKGINLMDRGERKKTIKSRIDYTVSLSQTYSTLLNACFGNDVNTYKVTGYPRNDYLFNSQGRVMLQKVLDLDLSDKKILLFTPTYRRRGKAGNLEGGKNYENFFGFDSFNIEAFNSFLKKNNLFFVLKLHPNEERFFKDTFTSDYSNICLLLDTTLAEYTTDLYEIVNAADMLITDYSSIYFDYLLLERPIVFAVPDLSSYDENRGFLVGPLSFWMPGSICSNYEQLIKTIRRNLDEDPYKKNRDILKQVVGHVKSCLQFQI